MRFVGVRVGVAIRALEWAWQLLLRKKLRNQNPIPDFLAFVVSGQVLTFSSYSSRDLSPYSFRDLCVHPDGQTD